MKKYTCWINQTFGRRIAAFFIPMIIILVLVVGGISSYTYYVEFRKQSQQNMAGIIQNRNYMADLYFQDIKTTSVLLSENDDLIYMLTDYENMTIKERFYQQEKIDEALRNTSLMKDYIIDCIIIGLNGYETNMPDRQDLKGESDLLEKDWIQPCVENPDGGFYYTGAHNADYYYGTEGEIENVISVILPVKPYGKRIGYIIVDLDFGNINDIMVLQNDVSGLRNLVADEEGNIVFSDNPDEINQHLPEETISYFGTEEPFFFEYDGKEMFCECQSSNTTNWEFIGMIPKENLIQPVARMVKILAVFVMPVFLILAFLLSVMISSRVKKPLNEIISQLDQLNINDPKPVLVKNSVGEINFLAEKITEMSRRITKLINEVYKAEIKSKDAQIEVLVSQINPHFLYNTLQLIKTEVVTGRTEEVSGTINCLSRFLRYTINNRKLFVTLFEELDYIKVYMDIYKKRFPDQFVLEIQVEEGILNIMIPKLTLQPIVENAIKHGLRNKEGKGIIRITAMEEEDLTVIVEDNGNGMDPEDIPELLEKIYGRADGDDHVGLANIHDRLEIAGGDGYGIDRIESEKGQFFKVWLKIKKGWNDV